MLVAYELIFSTCISTIKMSVMFFYLRVFVNPGLRLATKLVMAFVLLWSTGNILQVFIICRPFAATYDPAVHGHCGNQVVSFIAIGAFNVITDAMILTLPIPTIWRLKMSRSAKLGLSAIFMTGFIVSVVAIIRIVSLTRLNLQNLTGTMIWADFWSTVEPNLGILCVSLPMLGRLRSRLTSRRGASKLKGQASDISGSYKDSARQARHQEEFGLESMYAANKEVHHASCAVAGGREPGTSVNGTGSEEALSPAPQNSVLNKRGILVETEWTIKR